VEWVSGLLSSWRRENGGEKEAMKVFLVTLLIRNGFPVIVRSEEVVILCP
jgi:hypothetical protein